MLSIMILTMNRKNEIVRALKSCIECSLPEKTEFVIVDNASKDGTREAVTEFFHHHIHEYQYLYLNENIGAAAGRNEGIKISKGRFVYFLDDDAYIDGPKESFFIKMIDFLEENESVACITTKIYDTGLKDFRTIKISKKNHQIPYPKALMFHGGSFLLDKQRGFKNQDFFLGNQIRGLEELYPSLSIYFNYQIIAYINDLNVIHDPKNPTRYFEKNAIMQHIIHSTQGKIIFYPRITYPFIYLAFFSRIIKHLGIKALFIAYKQITQKNKGLIKKTVSFSHFTKFVEEFGLFPAL